MDEKLITKYISSFVWGDGALSSINEKYNQKNSQYYFKQLAVHKDYIDFQKEILENLSSVRVDYMEGYTDKRGYKCKPQYGLFSKKLPFFTKMRERFYFEGKKQIDPHYLKLWDEQSLCFFYMDNGWIDNTEQKSGKIYTRTSLATHAYSYGDVLLIKTFLKEKFDLNFDIQRHTQKSGEYKFYLKNSKENSMRFLDKIHKYSFPSFEYKFSTERFSPYKERVMI